jgi:N-glycosylase/DNA lyase
VPPAELRLDITLSNGQCFGWTRVDPDALKAAQDKAATKGKRKREANSTASSPTASPTSTPVKAASPAAAASPSASPSGSAMSDVINVKLEEANVDPLPDYPSLPTPIKAEPTEAGGAASAAAAASSSVQSEPALPSPSDPHYIGVLGRSVIGFRQTADDILYTEHFAAAGQQPTPPAHLDALLRDWLHLPSRYLDPATGVPASHSDMVLSSLYEHWSRAADSRRFQFTAAVFPGVRMLRQEPVECLFSFICSSNNHISRIGGMLASLRAKYGERIEPPPSASSSSNIAELLGLEDEAAELAPQLQQRSFYTFPTVEALCGATEAELRALGFGYRAKYIVQSASLLQRLGGAAYLHSLRLRPRAESERALECFAGIGPKVASCVSLFSLDGLDAIPVDTHVWQIAVRDYSRTAAQLGLADKGLDLAKVKSITPRVYTAVGDTFRHLFGPLAGWAHCILFLAELPEFKRRLAERGINELQLEEGQGAAATSSSSSSATVVAASTPLAASVTASSPATATAVPDPDATEDEMEVEEGGGAVAPPAKKQAIAARGGAKKSGAKGKLEFQ